MNNFTGSLESLQALSNISDCLFLHEVFYFLDSAFNFKGMFYLFRSLLFVLHFLTAIMTS